MNSRRTWAIPLAGPYALGVYLWEKAYQKGIFQTEKLPVPVVSVGSITVGGAGKTPLVLSLLDYFQKSNIRVGVLSRGYGGRRSLRKVPYVFHGPEIPSPDEVGDEPVLMCLKHPEALYCISPDRREGGKALVAAGVDLVLLDDGFQSLELFQDLKIVILPPDLPEEGWRGMQAFLPAGEFRDLPSRLLEAEILVDVGNEWDRSNVNAPDRWHAFLSNLALRQKTPRTSFPPLLKTSVRMNGISDVSSEGILPIQSLSEKNLAVVSGIARPERFLKMIEFYGLKPLGHLALPDHFRFSSRDRARIDVWIKKLEQSFHKRVDTILVTEKDWVKWGRDGNADPRIHPISIRTEWLEEEKWIRILQSRLKLQGIS